MRPQNPCMSIYIDIIPSLMKSKHGYTCFLLIVDGFSKLASAVAMKSKHEAEVTRVVLVYFLVQGIPYYIHSDSEASLIACITKLQSY